MTENKAKWAVRNDSTSGFLGQKYTLYDANFKRLGITEDHTLAANILINAADLQALMSGFLTESELNARMDNMQSGNLNGTGAVWVDVSFGPADNKKTANKRRAEKYVSY